MYFLGNVAMIAVGLGLSFIFSSSGSDPDHTSSSYNLPSASSLHCYVVCWNSAFHRWGAGGSQEGVRQIMGSRRNPQTPEPATTIHKEGPGGTGSLSKVRVFAKPMSLEDGRINEYPVILRTKKSQALIQIFALHFIVSPWVRGWLLIWVKEYEISKSRALRSRDLESKVPYESRIALGSMVKTINQFF